MDDNITIGYWIWTKVDPLYHKSLPISAIIPKQLCEKYNATLIFEYIRIFEKNSKLCHDVPQGIVQLIVSYYV